MMRITVKTLQRNYPVVVGVGLTSALRTLLRRCVGRSRLFLFFDANFYALYGQELLKSFGWPGDRCIEFVVPSGEHSKSPKTLGSVYEFLLDQRITRDDFVLACGGGVTTDLVGYAAATVLRGVRWGVVPTTLLGMVDAAIGGKTGIDHRQGKNLIGAFWQPSFVCCDIRYLTTLPPRQLLAGLGEVLKTAGLQGAKAVDTLESYYSGGDWFDAGSLTELVSFSAGYKAGVVSSDERDAGRRMVLNFGHTFGHGIEKAAGYRRLLHGEAVIIGIEAALALGERLGYRSVGLSEYRRLVSRMMVRLPRCAIDVGSVWQAMALDKKRSPQNHRFVILKRLGQPMVLDKVEPVMARAALVEAINHYGGRE